MNTTVVLLVDSTPTQAAAISESVTAVTGCRVEETRGIEATLDRIQQSGVGLVLWFVTDGSEGQQLLRQLSAVAMHQIPLVAVIAANDPELRLQLLAAGAVDCLGQPLDQSRLEFLVDILTVKARCSRSSVECQSLSTDDVFTLQFGSFIVNTPYMRQIMHILSQVAPLDTTVLLNGETGTGKTYTARVIHELSPRRTRPFVIVHCGSLPPSLLESELFGHCRGAFTGADRNQEGKLAAAKDGTVLLDEVDSVPLEAQAKLLQVVEERVFEPLGSAQTRPFRARLIAAANRPLEEEVAAGRFRADLYYRLNVVALRLPPLRERPEAVLPLVQNFLEHLSRQAQREFSGISDAAMRAMEGYSWPGNIRELRNVIERAVVLCAHPVVEVADLPETIQKAYCMSPVPADHAPPAPTRTLVAVRNDVELERLREALQRNHSNRTLAAAELGISRVTLYKKLRRYQLI